jgi:hypothetical protein
MHVYYQVAVVLDGLLVYILDQTNSVSFSLSSSSLFVFDGIPSTTVSTQHYQAFEKVVIH